MYDVYVNMKASPLDSDDNTYISGQLGMFINGPWIINGLRENEINFGVTAVPMNEGVEPKSSMIPRWLLHPDHDLRRAQGACVQLQWNTGTPRTSAPSGPSAAARPPI